MPSARTVTVGPLRLGGGRPFVFIGGPCVIESRDHAMRHAAALRAITERVGVPLVYKSSFDKANRTAGAAYRGPGLHDGLEILAAVRREVGVPVITDVHEPSQVAAVAEVADVLQTPAFLCRQTDFLLAVAGAGRPVNVKKGQFLAPWDMGPVLGKLASTGNHNLMVTERGVSFGYNNLVADMRSLPALAEFGYPVVYDAGHSVQLPGGQGTASGGQRHFIRPLARAAVAVGVDAVFLEVHENPDQALSDGPNSYRLDELEALLRELKRIDALTKES
ncbi:MAG: 2-dehydro-3-deoxyphosphooctonate aldolase [Deltaproteobacteria bacterium]|jgi:2-dehydro-3-deoxyphosphooctonate aldolase (KDO 8-P synthase)|nr:2-dehydro-3-deoxyphosphooctonate aldolase [Deltaproteobacteria bacterium]